jgi:ribosomal protein S18 acetylase RimI-like enzyme
MNGFSTRHASPDAAIAFARGEGATGLILETARANVAARALYRAAGWQEAASQ